MKKTDMYGNRLPIRYKDFDRELERLGVDCDAIGPVDSFCAVIEGTHVRIYDDAEEILGPKGEILAILRNLPDDVGWESVWSALGEWEQVQEDLRGVQA